MAGTKRRKETPCDRGEHVLFDTLGGDKLCALGCGHRIEGAGSELLTKDEKKRKLALESNDAALLAMLESDE